METSYTKNERENIKQKSWWIIELQIYMYVFRSYTNEKKTKEISYHNKLVFEVFFSSSSLSPLKGHLSKQIGDGFTVMRTTNGFGEHHGNIDHLKNTSTNILARNYCCYTYGNYAWGNIFMASARFEFVQQSYLDFIGIFHIFFLRNRIGNNHGFEWWIIDSWHCRSTEYAMSTNSIHFARTCTQ